MVLFILSTISAIKKYFEKRGYLISKEMINDILRLLVVLIILKLLRTEALSSRNGNLKYLQYFFFNSSIICLS